MSCMNCATYRIEAEDLLDKLAASEARVDRAIQGWIETQNELMGAKVKLIDAEARAERAEKKLRQCALALSALGAHQIGCSRDMRYRVVAGPCDCGLQEEIDAARAEGGE